MALADCGEELGLGDGTAGAGVDGDAAGDGLDGDADDVAELLRLEGVEFACAAGDEDATGSGVDALGDVAGQQVEVDRAGLGEGRDGEEQNAVELGSHRGGLLGEWWWGQSWVSWPSMRRHRWSGLPSAIALGSNDFGTSW